MPGHFCKQTVMDFFPVDDGRLRVLAFGTGSYHAKSRTGSWAWLLEAQGQDRGLLYTGRGQVCDRSNLDYAAIAALGSYLGFPAQVVAFWPSLPQSFRLTAVPEPYYNQIQQYFETDDKNLGKSHFNLAPDIFSFWPGYNLLRYLATSARFAKTASSYEIVEHCPLCGEFRLGSQCGCGTASLLFPTFESPAMGRSPKNRLKAFPNWIGKYKIDYLRQTDKCPDCKGPLLPLAGHGSAWKCASCGLERGMSVLQPARILSLPAGKDTSVALEPAALPVIAAVKPEPQRKKAEIASLPLQLLNSVSSLYPEIWKKVDSIRDERLDNKGKLPWDAAIFLPSGDWKHLLNYYQQNYGAPANARAFYRLMATGSWRPTQDIITFDPALYEALVTTPLAGKLPYEQLSRFPAWCLYFDAPGLIIEANAYNGFFAMLDEAFGHQHLCLYFLGGQKEYFVQPIRLGNWDLKEGFLRNLKNSPVADKNRLARLMVSKLSFDQGIVAAINLILYAFTQTNMVMDRNIAAIHRPQARKTKKGWRMFAPPKPAFHLLGEEIGQQLREAAATPRASSGQRSGPCPHIRRGHWHHFWKGPKKSILDLRWLPPIPVALAQTELA